jgi:uncharacterized membrane protein (UPF0127 family)
VNLASVFSCAVTAAIVLGASSVAVAAPPARWCTAIPLERSFCPALTLEAPRTTLRLAVADNDALRTRGLMGVRRIPAGEGMLFVFPDVAGAHHEFWMKDTLVPLDMIFVEDDGTVSSVFGNVPASTPKTRDDAVARRAGTGRYVIELATGEARRAGITVGTHLPITGF